MKLIFKTLLKYYLKYAARLVLFIRRPVIIAIAGSTNKSFVKEKIVETLKAGGLSIGSNPKSFNTEIGLPLAILNLPSGYNDYKLWPAVMIKAIPVIFKAGFPKILVLELGVSRPGDMKYLLSIIKPKIAVITEITQRYLESFSDMDELTGEYEYLVGKMDKKETVILNYDNMKIMAMAGKTKAKIIFFGQRKTGETDNVWQAAEISDNISGQLVKIKNDEGIKSHAINRFGRHHVYALLVGLIIKKLLNI